MDMFIFGGMIMCMYMYHDLSGKNVDFFNFLNILILRLHPVTHKALIA